MYNVEIRNKPLKYLKTFFRKYREYYEFLYEDSWLWSEEQIIEWYFLESDKRIDEIFKLIKNKLSDESVLWRTLENTIFIRWRTKYIFIKWNENKNIKTRYITNIEIR